METLDTIAKKYGTDKSSDAHFYTRYYEKYFEPLRTEKIRVLEIGIQNGFSLKMWKEYFPHAEIVGFDIQDCKHMEEDRVTTFRGDQGNPSDLKAITGPFDIIIDDGSHKSAHMRTSFDTLFPLLKKGGIYVVEDLHCCYWPAYKNWNPFKKGNFIGRLKKLMDQLNAHGKSGYAYDKNNKSKVSYDQWEESIEYIHMYRSIVFIKKI